MAELSGGGGVERGRKPEGGPIGSLTMRVNVKRGGWMPVD